MKTYTIKNNNYRIKQLSAVELLAFKTQINFDTLENTIKMYNTILEVFEVQIKDQWFAVKKNDTFYPKGIENDIETVDELLSHFLIYIQEVFQLSKA